jgi:hypothetical protein
MQMQMRRIVRLLLVSNSTTAMRVCCGCLPVSGTSSPLAAAGVPCLLTAKPG